MKIKLSLLASVIACFLFAACARNSNEKTIAKVGGMKITETYLNEKLGEISPETAGYLHTALGRKQLLDILIHEKLILLAARKSPVAASELYRGQVRKMEEEMKKRLDEYKDYILAKMWIEDMRQVSLKVADAEIDEYFYKHPYEILIEHYHFPSYKEAEDAVKKMRSGSAMKDVSGGKLPPMMYGEFIPELEDVAFNMRTGEIQGVIATKMGFHAIKKISQAKKELTGEIKERTRKIVERKKFDAHLENLQSKYKVEVLDGEYK
ncbi:MAG: peptidylprolyl isomerase [Elusimicrobia bacterium]|nr:peptidylprolyl isomerase [Elusimicrobiota bacterium]